MTLYCFNTDTRTGTDQMLFSGTLTVQVCSPCLIGGLFPPSTSSSIYQSIVFFSQLIENPMEMSAHRQVGHINANGRILKRKKEVLQEERSRFRIEKV